MNQFPSPWPRTWHRALFKALSQMRLRTKLSLVVVVATLLTSLLLFAAVTVLEYHDSRSRVQERSLGLVRVLAQNTRASLAFSDSASATKVLHSLEVVPDVRWALLLDDRQEAFASYVSAGEQMPAVGEVRKQLKGTFWVQGARLYSVEPVRMDETVLGQLVLCTDTAPAFSATLTRAALVLLGAALIGMLASVVAVKVQDGVVEPIVGLAAVMQSVSQTHSYSTRVSTHWHDEVGALYAGFNRLLSELEGREAMVKRQQDKLFMLAHVDAVTGLSNRYHFRQALDEAISHLPAQPFAVLCLDLDRFKTVNDALGHDIGDQLLALVGHRLKRVARSTDKVARLGGDEFAMILGDVSEPGQAERVAQRILEALCTSVELAGLTIPLGVSVGIALAPHDGAQPDGLLKNADLALYSAKSSGRGRACFYEAGMSAGVVRRLQLERSLRQAMAAQQLYLVFQPQLDLTTGRVTGFEALVRWRHPELGEIPPLEFIGIAEDSGLINELGSWVLEHACQCANTWPQDMGVAVNLSAVQVMTQDLPVLISQTLQRTGLAPARLELEITESVLLSETAATLAQLHGLNRLGVQIALDDFGTGYSSLAYLRRFPFNKLKIDRAFVKGVTHETDARVIVRAIIDLASGLHMTTLAEGVESQDELDILIAEGCHQAQGYLLSRPMRSEAIRPFLARWHEDPWAQTGIGQLTTTAATGLLSFTGSNS